MVCVAVVVVVVVVVGELLSELVHPCIFNCFHVIAVICATTMLQCHRYFVPGNVLIFFFPVFACRLALKLGVHTLNDWYHVTKDQIYAAGGAGLLHYYNNSPIRMLQDLFPHNTWAPWKFSQVSQAFWTDKENIRQYFDWVVKQQLQLQQKQQQQENQQDGTQFLDYSVLSQKAPQFFRVHHGGTIAEGRSQLNQSLTTAFPGM